MTGYGIVWKPLFMGTDKQQKWGKVFKSDHDLLQNLEEGDVIAVRLCVRFQGWEIWAKDGCLIFDIGNPRGMTFLS